MLHLSLLLILGACPTEKKTKIANICPHFVGLISPWDRLLGTVKSRFGGLRFREAYQTNLKAIKSRGSHASVECVEC